MIHRLKTLLGYYGAVASGEKLFEVRRDDRGFAVGDELVLLEWVPAPKLLSEGAPRDAGVFTGRELRARVTYVLRDFEGLAPGFVGLGILPYTLST